MKYLYKGVPVLLSKTEGKMNEQSQITYLHDPGSLFQEPMLTFEPFKSSEHYRKSPPVSDPDTPTIRLAEIICQYANLIANIRNDTSITSASIFHEAQILEHEVHD